MWLEGENIGVWARGGECMKHVKAPKLFNDGRKLQYLWRIGGFPYDVGLPMVAVYHDDWCGIDQGKPCHCNPNITLKATVPGTMH
jgi:hypothetical protein